jgi:hypothetical protein
MNTRKKYIRYIVFVFFALVFMGLTACQSSKSQTHKPTRYTKTRTRHQPNWNAASSQKTTYYIKKHSTRKSHDSKKVKR